MKKISKLLIVLILIILTPTSYVQANDIRKILLINSYNVESIWEYKIIKGIKEEINENLNINIKMEYLDTANSQNQNYLDEYLELLNTKYKDDKFDMIVTVDDEAFNMVRKELFNEKSIFYKKTVVFTGVNNSLNLTSAEKKYITGFMDGGSKVELIKFITTLQPEVKDISVIIDNTGYSKNIKNKLLENKYLLDKNINLNFIQGKNKKDILNQIKNSSDLNEALLICGIFKNEDNGENVKPENLIEEIKQIKDVPIYTSRDDYINKGTIGGYIDIPESCGRELGKMILKIYNEGGISKFSPVDKIGANYIVDYKQIYKYNINTLSIPKGTIVINKKYYQLLLPKSYRIGYLLAWFATILIIIYIITKMTEYKRNEAKNKKLYQMAKEREQLKTDFIANMSHELRTPLNIITSASMLLEMKSNKEETVSSEYILDKLSHINQSSNRLRRLINNLIDISKFDSGFFECKCKNENIVYVVEDIVHEVVDYAKEKNIELIFDTEEEEIISFIDKEKIERVILNLLSNAIKFTNENGKIEVYMKSDDNFIYITIKDNGIGISKEKIDHIFQRFYQVDNLLSRGSEGSGIGLCIVDEIIRMHGGKINIESEINKGTTFEIVLNVSKSNFIDKEEEKTDRNIKDIVKVEMSDI
ncbi:MAG: ATP-binding protein [Clostridiales bacterium]|uniref:ATP-binding protein n=1 Tax=Terrisporobacter sp. TaxID=1965305 RepID=UPI002A54450A|nr:ATP-binding protein [Terrisporobacter sp.]MDD7755698.1 ATP-binding protein [Clostridiales bacterium]MDY4134296.1 ATP-binding protein [Terrisporobacter sp.]